MIVPSLAQSTPKAVLTQIFQTIYSSFVFPLGWAAVVGMALMNSLWLSGIWLILPSPLPAVQLLLIPLFVKTLCRLLALADLFPSRVLEAFDRFSIGVEYIALCLAASYEGAIFSYLACSLNYPLADQKLNLLDKFLGFNWLQLYHFYHIPLIKKTFELAYTSIFNQLFFFGLWFGFLRRKERLYEIFWILFMALTVTLVISAFFPALGPMSLLGLEHQYTFVARHALADINSIRSGINPDFTTHSLGGIIVFPSFHTVCAIVYAYGFRKSGAVGYFVLLLNIAMLCSIPIFGNHYLVDVIAGAMIAMLSIFCVRLITKYRAPAVEKSFAGL